jgi:DNA-binding transcriptional MerR regulator
VQFVETDLISKKELLELTGISYGQLYRWKRKKLIPEEWFIRKSTFTGQETFFPREKMLARIEKIKNMKEDLSLDEIADLFSPLPMPRAVKRSELAGLVSETALRFFVEQHGDPEEWEFERVLAVYVLDRLLKTGEMSLHEGAPLFGLLKEHADLFNEKGCVLIFFRKMGVSGFALVANGNEIRFDEQVKTVVRLNLATLLEELKVKLI